MIISSLDLKGLSLESNGIFIFIAPIFSAIIQQTDANTVQALWHDE